MRANRPIRLFPAVSLRLFICVVVIIGVGFLTVTAHTLMQQRVVAQTDYKFVEVTDTYVRQLSQQLDGSSNLLYAMRGLFAAADVDAAGWDRFIQTQHSFERYPGMDVIGYAEIVSSPQKPAYLARLRQDLKLPAATIYPSKAAGDQVVLTYLREAKPAEPRSLEPYGFDLSSEPVRREALEQAHASGGIAATAPIHLLPKDKPGFLLILPLSNKAAVTLGSAEQITGYGVAAFDVESLANTVLGHSLAQYKSSMTITDISDTQPATLYTKTIKASGRLVQRDVTLQVANRTWRITFQTPASTLLMVTDRLAPAAVLAGGIVVILSAGALFYTLKLRNRLKCMITS